METWQLDVLLAAVLQNLIVILCVASFLKNKQAPKAELERNITSIIHKVPLDVHKKLPFASHSSLRNIFLFLFFFPVYLKMYVTAAFTYVKGVNRLKTISDSSAWVIILPGVDSCWTREGLEKDLIEKTSSFSTENGEYLHYLPILNVTEMMCLQLSIGLPCIFLYHSKTSPIRQCVFHMKALTNHNQVTP